MRRNTLAALTFGFVLMGTATAVAHHAFSAEFDNQKRIEKRGYVTKVEWTNPHVWFYINVKDEKTGKVTNYGWEMGSPNGLMRRGWTRNSLKVGQVVTVEGSMAKDGSNNANASTVTIDGKKLFAGSSGDPAN